MLGIEMKGRRYFGVDFTDEIQRGRLFDSHGNAPLSCIFIRVLLYNRMAALSNQSLLNNA